MTFHSPLYQALSLDIFVLESLLKRHKNSHGRTRYFRHLAMTLQSLQTYQVVELEMELHNLSENLSTYTKTTKKKQKKGPWELKSSRDPEQLSLQQEFSSLQTKLTKQLPEISSRILHASQSMYTEVTRGFFLPFCTVALGALARIFTLIHKLGRMGISQLHDLATSTDFITFSSDQIEEAMGVFLAINSASNKEEDVGNILLASMGFTVSSKKSYRKREAMRVQRYSESPIQMEDKEYGDTHDTVDASLKKQDEGNHDDDLGESVVEQYAAHTNEMSSSFTTEKVKPSESDSKQSAVDRNASLLQNFKDNSIKEEKKKRRPKKRRDAALGELCDPKKKKKKKKAKKTDFFDNLFD
jgi:hypothetical protein